MKTGTRLIELERERQINEEGWTSEHDEEHWHEEMAMAAAAYAFPSDTVITEISVDSKWVKRIYRDSLFPFPFWQKKWWKPCKDASKTETENRIRELVKAGALIAAEIDRLQNKDK